MKVGDLVDDGLGNIGIVCKKTLANDGHYFVRFPNAQHSQLSLDGWYWNNDLKIISKKGSNE